MSRCLDFSRKWVSTHFYMAKWTLIYRLKLVVCVNWVTSRTVKPSEGHLARFLWWPHIELSWPGGAVTGGVGIYSNHKLPYVSTFKVLVIIHLLSICVNLIWEQIKEIPAKGEHIPVLGVWTLTIPKLQEGTGVNKLMVQGSNASSVAWHSVFFY